MDYTVIGGSRSGDAKPRETGCERGENGLVTEPWIIDELAHAGPEHLDPAFVAGYDRKQGYPDPAEDLAIFAAHGLDGTSAVLDLAAGSGQFALAAARRFGHVTAVDVSPAMIALLRERAATAGLANLDCVRAGLPQLRPLRPARGRRVHPQRAAPAARLLEGGGPGPDRADDATRRRAPAARPDLRLPPGRGGQGVPAVVRVRREPIPPTGTPPRTTPSTSAPSSARSAGCSSRCWPRPASRS